MKKYRLTLQPLCHTLELEADSYHESYDHFTFFRDVMVVAKIDSVAVRSLWEQDMPHWRVCSLTGGKTTQGEGR